MAGVQVTNNAASSLSGSINNAVTSMSVQAGHGARFPAASLASGNYFYVTLLDAANNIEIVKVTDRTVDVFTIVRARDGTTARSFAANDRVELRPVAALFNELPNRLLLTADYTDLSVTSVKLALMATVSPNTYGGLGRALTLTVNSKGLVTAISEANAFVQRDQFDYTGSAQTWTKPTGRGTMVRVQMWGAGGGGARCAAGSGAGGGGGGGYKELWFYIGDLSSTATITIGQGGAAGASDGTDGTSGASTTFVSGSVSVTAYAGVGGKFASTTFTGGSGGGPVSIGGGGIGNAVGNTGTNVPSQFEGAGGGAGSSGVSVTGNSGRKSVYGGGGGSGCANTTDASNFCLGGTSELGGSGGRGSVDIGGASPINATAGVVPGGGGGGAENSAAGAGAHGRCIVTVY